MVDVARGDAPTYRYQKGSPFNAALLFGLHLTVIGRVGDSAGRAEADDAVKLSSMSRGSSRVWTAPFSSSYRSAWDRSGENSVRVAVGGGRIVGALVLGNQDMADPLRQLIEQSIDVSAFESELLSSNGHRLSQALLQAWRESNKQV